MIFFNIEKIPDDVVGDTVYVFNMKKNPAMRRGLAAMRRDLAAMLREGRRSASLRGRETLRFAPRVGEGDTPLRSVRGRETLRFAPRVGEGDTPLRSVRGRGRRSASLRAWGRHSASLRARDLRRPRRKKKPILRSARPSTHKCPAH